LEEFETRYSIKEGAYRPARRDGENDEPAYTLTGRTRRRPWRPPASSPDEEVRAQRERAK
jgi:hypothetical protein